MKNTRKILIALLVMMTLLVGMFAITASAENGTVVYFQPTTGSDSWDAYCEAYAVYYWEGGSNGWVLMEEIDTVKSIYSATIPAGYTNLSFVSLNSAASGTNWENKNSQTVDLTIPTDGSNFFILEVSWNEASSWKGTGSWSKYSNTCAHSYTETVVSNATCTTDGSKNCVCTNCGDTYVATISATGHSYSGDTCSSCGNKAVYIIAGTESLCGSNWDNGDENNKMSLVDGLYTKVFENVASGSHSFKVVRDSNWSTCWGDSTKESTNYEFNVANDNSTVKITFNASTNEIGCTVTAPTVIVDVYTVAGSKGLCGVEWGITADANNDMALGEDGLYTKTFTGIAKGGYSFKVVKNRSWDNTWPSDNYDFYVKNDNSTVTITFNTETGEVSHAVYYNDQLVELYIVAGDSGLCGSNWAHTDLENEMTKLEDGKYQISYTGIAAATYEIKIVKNGNWNFFWGDTSKESGNLGIVVAQNNSTVTITFDQNATENHITVDVKHICVEQSVEAVAPTCTATGTTAGTKCSACGTILSGVETVDATGHSYVADVTPATCTEAGKTVYTCSSCGDSYEEDIPKLDHTYNTDEWGYKGSDGHAHVCSCGAKDEVVAHTPNVEAASEGVAKYCTACEYVIQAALDHVCNITVLQKDAEGHWYKCTGCENTSEKVAHSGGAATCTEKAKCSTCDQPYGESLGHSWVNANCTTPKTCSVCFASEGDALGHSWTNATCTTPKTCSVCFAAEGEALGHTFVEGKCECGASDPDYVAPVEPQPEPQPEIQPEPEHNIFEIIWNEILAFFNYIVDFFKNLIPVSEE